MRARASAPTPTALRGPILFPATSKRSLTRRSSRAISAEAAATALRAGSGSSPAAVRSSRSLIDASGLRTSWATPAATRPSAASRSFCASSRASRSVASRELSRSRDMARMPSAMPASSAARGVGTGVVRSLPSAVSVALSAAALRRKASVAHTAVNTSSAVASASPMVMMRQVDSACSGTTR